MTIEEAVCKFELEMDAFAMTYGVPNYEDVSHLAATFIEERDLDPSWYDVLRTSEGRCRVKASQGKSTQSS